MIILYSCPKNLNSFFLAAYFMVLSTYGIAHYYATESSSPVGLAITFNHFSPLWVLAGPLLFFYVRGTLSDNFHWRKYDWLHGIPFIIYLISVGPYYITPFDEKISIAKSIQENVDNMKSIRVNLFFSPQFNFLFRSFHLFAYQLFCIVLLARSQSRISVQTTPAPQLKLVFRWLWSMLTINVLLSVSYFIVLILAISDHISTSQIVQYPFHVISG